MRTIYICKDSGDILFEDTSLSNVTNNTGSFIVFRNLIYEVKEVVRVYTDFTIAGNNREQFKVIVYIKSTRNSMPDLMRKTIIDDISRTWIKSTRGCCRNALG